MEKVVVFYIFFACAAGATTTPTFKGETQDIPSILKHYIDKHMDTMIKETVKERVDEVLDDRIDGAVEAALAKAKSQSPKPPSPDAISDNFALIQGYIDEEVERKIGEIVDQKIEKALNNSQSEDKSNKDDVAWCCFANQRRVMSLESKYLKMQEEVRKVTKCLPCETFVQLVDNQEKILSNITRVTRRIEQLQSKSNQQLNLVNQNMAKERDEVIKMLDSIERFIISNATKITTKLSGVEQACMCKNTNISYTMDNLRQDLNETASPEDCLDVYTTGVRQSGVYTIQPQNSTAFQAYCDMEDAGWTVIIKRVDGSLKFSRTWDEYKQGFGNLSHEFWLGNDNIHYLTNQKNYTLKVEYVEWANNQSYYSTYNGFRVENETNKYRLHVSGFAGNGSNALYGHRNPVVRHHGMYFSTIDRDHDRWPGSCASYSGKAGFWYNRCSAALTTGPYRQYIPCMEWYWPTCTKSQIWKIKPDN